MGVRGGGWGGGLRQCLMAKSELERAKSLISHSRPFSPLQDISASISLLADFGKGFLGVVRNVLITDGKVKGGISGAKPRFLAPDKALRVSLCFEPSQPHRVMSRLPHFTDDLTVSQRFFHRVCLSLHHVHT